MAEVLDSLAAPAAPRNLKSKETLNRSLDDLLERYLNLLDQYQSLQQGLARHLSSGYLALAQANFSNPNRIRYGQDYYDDRMQASARVSTESSSPSFSILNPASVDSSERSNPCLLEKVHPSTANAEDPSQSPEESNPPRDPLHWFGILLPPALRASQRSFQKAVMDDIPALSNVTKQLRELEIEVKRTRKNLRKAS